jgi:hypothetical protein
VVKRREAYFMMGNSVLAKNCGPKLWNFVSIPQRKGKFFGDKHFIMNNQNCIRIYDR